MSGPLEGVRILDFTSAWAGPMATRCLAFLGAEVVKIEGPNRLDSWRDTVRGVEPARYPDMQRGERPYNRSSRFNSQNHDKLDLVVDLKHPQARGLMLRLARQCDVVIDNFSPGVLRRLGLGYEDFRTARPDIVMVEMPAYGNTGPEADNVAFGPNMEAMAGMAAMIGYGDGVPVTTSGAYLDPIGGLHGAGAVLTALIHRQRTGQGQYVEVPQRETAMQTIGELLLQQIETGETFAPHGNRIPGAAPHEAFPCRGEEEWVAIAAFTEGEWRSLCAAIGRPALLTDPRFCTLLDRKRNEDALEAEVAAWTRRHTKEEAAALLQAHGVTAAPVATGRDIFADEQLDALGFYVELDHADAGRHRYPGLAFHLGATPGVIRRPPPLFAEHNRHVLVDRFGLSQEEYAALEGDGVIASAPLGRE